MNRFLKRRTIVALSITALLMTALPGIAQENTGYVKAKVKPGRAGVFVDDEYVGPAGNYGRTRKYAVSPGQHEIKLVEPRYEEKTVTVTVEAGRTTKIKEQLKPIQLAKPPFGHLKIERAGKYDAVYINGAYYGHADEFNGLNQGQNLVPGEYTVKLEKADGSVQEEKITIVANKATRIYAN